MIKKHNILKLQTFITALTLLITNLNLYSQIRYELPELRSSAYLRIELAKAEIGVTEENNPIRVREYQKTVCIPADAAWCSAFQYFISKEANKQLKQINQYPKSGLANYIYNYARRKGTKTIYIAKQGDYIVWKVANQIYGHVGLVTKVNQSTVETIEGNTGSATIRTGGMVAKKTRSITNPIGRLKVQGLVGFVGQY